MARQCVPAARAGAATGMAHQLGAGGGRTAL